MNLSDNLEIPSNSWIVFNPGNYVIPDVGNNGLVQINGKENIILDGTGVNVDGTNYQGYMIKISNSNNIEIRNFSSVSHYYYAVHIMNSHHINIFDNNFSYNKVDSSGWISIWTNYQQALGGGVMMYQTQYANILGNQMKFQNDGVALYHCDSIVVINNDFEWNTSFGIRMYFTDNCLIQNNIASHINRPYTNPSDCAAILLIVSNNNYVVNNDFSYSGDGIFLGQFQYSQILNNNYFAYNECSYSPHNAIEATFADGNVFEYNNCNYSHYGLWLGYSFNSIVRGNQIYGNQYAGIAIDRGYNNQILENEINFNPTAIELWEGDGIVPYQNQNSGDYFIYDNLIEGNTVAISLKNTEHTLVETNFFINNRNGIYIFGEAENDSITDNVFDNTALYHIENNSANDIYAVSNDFIINDEAIIECKIFDNNNNPASGYVIWQPFQAGINPVFQNNFPMDMAEPPSEWNAYPEACWGYGGSIPTTIEWDYDVKWVGEASVHVTTGNGWDIGVMYRPAGDSIASWSLTEQDTLVFWIRSVNTSVYGFQFCKVTLGNNCGGYYQYTAPASTILNPSIGQWRKVKIVLSGVSPWSRSSFGDISLDDIHYVEIHADTWDYGFHLWIDGVRFNGVFTQQHERTLPVQDVQISPNPARERVRVIMNLIEPEKVSVNLFDITGKLIQQMSFGTGKEGVNEFLIPAGHLNNGIYSCQLVLGQKIITKRIIIAH